MKDGIVLPILQSLDGPSSSLRLSKLHVLHMQVLDFTVIVLQTQKF